MSGSVEKAVTFIEAVKESLAGATRYNSGDSVPPAAVLWTDADGEWQPIVTRLRGGVDDGGGFELADERQHAGPIADIEFVVAETWQSLL